MNRDFTAILPEATFVVGGAIALLRGSVREPANRSRIPTSRSIAFLTALVALALLSVEGRRLAAAPPYVSMVLSPDSFARGVRMLVAALAVFEFLPNGSSRAADRRQPSMLLFALAGLGVVVMARNLLVMSAAVEVAAVATTAYFAMAASSVRRATLLSAESAGTGLLLGGLAVLFALVRTFDMPRAGAMIVELTRERGHLPQIVFVAIAVFTTGLLVKLGVVPLARARFQASGPSDASAFAELVPGAVGIAAMARLADVLLSGRQVITAGLDGPWPLAVGVLALVTLMVGIHSARVSTRRQSFVRGIGVLHLGFAELALSSFTRSGQAAAFLELLSGLTLTLVLQRSLSRGALEDHDDEAGSFDDFRGRGRREPLVGLAVGLALATSLGIPPTFGFVARLASMDALLEGAGPFRPWFTTLAAAAVIATVLQALVLVRFARVFYAGGTMEEERTTNRGAILVLVTPLVFLVVFAAPAVNFVEGCVLALE